MSINYSAELTYGVRLNNSEMTAITKRPDFEDIMDEWFICANSYNRNENVVIGFIMDGVDEGEIIEPHFDAPTGKMLDRLLSVLNELGINRKPSWHLICQVT